MSNESNIPSQVRIRTDPADGHAHRYDVIQDAKDVFGAGNNTDAIIAACEHARRDLEAKERALEWMDKNLTGDEQSELMELLSTPEMTLERETHMRILTK